jgi:hypothetical protein
VEPRPSARLWIGPRAGRPVPDGGLHRVARVDATATVVDSCPTLTGGQQVSERTALEGARLTIRGERGELNADGGRITISKQALTQDAPTTVEFGVDEVRGAQVQTPSRGSRGWLHVGVVGGSPPPPGDLAAAADPFTLPLTSRSVGAARRFARLVDRHVQGRGMPPEVTATEGRLSSSVAVSPGPAGARPREALDPPPAASYPPPPPPPPVAGSGRTETPSGGGSGADATSGDQVDPTDLVEELRTLADLHQRGALSDAEFELAKARVLG